MKQQKLNYRFHNPNTPEETAEFLFRLFIEVNKNKVERALRAAVQEMEKEEQNITQDFTPQACTSAKSSICKRLTSISSELPSVHCASTQNLSR